MTMTQSLADALSGGARYIKWDDLGVGQSVSGSIVNIEMRQSRKFQSTDLDYWDDGKPKMQAVITISTEQRDPSDAEDDGARSITVNLWSGQKQALAAACKAAGVAEPQRGQTFTATWTKGVGRAGDPRIFAYTLGAVPAGLGSALGTVATVNTATGELTQPPAAAAAPAAPAATPDLAAVAAAMAALTPEQRKAMGLA